MHIERIKKTIPLVLAIAFIAFVIFSHPLEKNQPASVSESFITPSISKQNQAETPVPAPEPTKPAEVKQPEEELWESVERVPNNIYAYYPLAVGNKWEYAGQQKIWDGDGANGKELIKPYDHTITIKTIKKNKENVYRIERETCNGKDNDYNPGECSSDMIYLVNNNICYGSDCSDDLALSFPLPEEQVLMTDYYKNRMTAVDDKKYVYYVHEKIKKIVLGKERNKCFPIEYRTLPDESIDTFCYGIGYVSSYYTHHGTLDDRNDKLINVNFKIINY